MAKYISLQTVKKSKAMNEKKDAYYFSHDANARNDVKVLRVRRQLGLEGYAIYFMLLECLREQVDYRLTLAYIPDLAYNFGTSEEKVKAVVMNYELFTLTEEMFYSERLCRSMAEYNYKKMKYVEAGRLGGQASVKQRLTNGQTPPEQPSSIKVNKRKENKSKKKENIEEDNPAAPVVVMEKIKNPFSENFLPHWSRWLKYKKEQHRFTYKSSDSEQAALNDLFKLSSGAENSAIQIIEQSIAKGWQGLFQLKKEANATHIPGTPNSKQAGAYELLERARASYDARRTAGGEG